MHWAFTQKPPGGREFVDREAGKLITRPMLLDMVPTYRDCDSRRTIYHVDGVNLHSCLQCQENHRSTIQSALNQTYRDFDIVICNDGSTDGTGEHLDMMYGDHPKIQIIHQSNGGIGAAAMLAFALQEACTFSNLTAMTNCFQMPSLPCCRNTKRSASQLRLWAATSGIRKGFVGRGLALPNFTRSECFTA